MNSRQRVLSALARQGYDRIPVHHEGTPEVNTLLKQHFGITDVSQLPLLTEEDVSGEEPEEQ